LPNPSENHIGVGTCREDIGQEQTARLSHVTLSLSQSSEKELIAT